VVAIKPLVLGANGFEETVGFLVRHSGTAIGTGADQEICHGFTAAPKRLDLIPLDVGESTVFSNRTVDTTHFHITVSVGRSFAWMAEDW
jgi:hypothetical protein